MTHLIAPSHTPGVLERNKDLSTQESYITGPILRDDLNSKVFYSQGSGLVKKGATRHINEDDIWRLDELNKARTLWESFEPYWQEELKNPKPSLRTAVFKRFKTEFIDSLGLMIAYSICTFINPVILPFLIDFVVDTSVPAYQGYIFVFCIILSQLIGSFCYHLSVFKGSIIGIDLRSLIALLVYRKSLTMAPKKDLNTGQIVNLVSGEAILLADTIPYFIMGLSGPFQVVISVVLLGVYISFYLVILVGLLAICLPISLKFGRMVGVLHYLSSLEADKRLKLTNELLQGIRIVKYYAWENAFKQNVDKQRESELAKISRLTLFRSLSLSLMQNIGSLGQGLTLIFYGLFGPGLTLSITFTIVAIFNLVRQGFVGLPISIVLGEMYLSTFKRIQEYVDEADIAPVPTLQSDEARIKIDNATFQWGTASIPTLKNINLDAKKGDFIMVVGSVGSGKSSVISAILGELAITSGSMGVSGSIGYVAQEAFIFNATVRENIIFGKPYDATKYHKVLEASALMTDLAQFEAGDMTEIGERGVNLSGGQKQRISIARALYSDADVVLLDDPLSAVDSHVGKHLFQKAVRGYLLDKLVILTANQLQYLPYADHIIFLNEGDVVVSGKFNELMQSNQQFKEQMIRFGVTGQNENESEEEPPVKPPTTVPKQNVTKPPLTEENDKDMKSGTLVVSEDKAEGLIGLNIYWHYFKKGGLAVFFTIILFLALCVGARIVSGWWLSIWLSGGYSLSVPQYVGIYGALIGADVLCFFVAALTDVSLSTRASRHLHRGLLSKVIRAPTAFFDITPLGRILNRFAKELDLIDTLLPIQLFNWINSVFSMLAVLASMAFASPYLLIAIVAVVVAYYFFQLHFRKTYVETQRLEALSRAPIFSQLGETMRGAATIRAYKMEQIFKNVNYWNIDINSKHRFAQRYLISWFNLILDAIGTSMVLILMILIVSLRVSGASAIQGGLAAFALANTSGLTPILSWLAFNAVEIEAKINSVERIKEYDTLEQEAPEVIKENRPPKNWPDKGEIVFRDASLRYRQGELVLKKLNVKIDGEEKVGIVGRTGAGKSTLLQALFRIVELAEGSIEIDGVDISTIGLHDLRSKLSIIPQEPVLFLGTVRYNLDPFNEYSDRDIWDALAMVNLKSYIETLSGGLDAIVEENGSNFSVGQRQLMCMSRALLRKTKIFFMDEATASVDLDTDLLIQSMVRKNFSDRTSLTIAHRLNTVMDSTKILVLNRGELAEYGKPSDLLNNSSGIFASMVEATGADQSAYLKKIANGEVGFIQSLKDIQSSSFEYEQSSSESIS